MEIERKFLMGRFPDFLDCVGHFHIAQLYLSVEPEVRIREKAQVDENGELTYLPHRLTVKGDGNLSRQEFEIDISREAFYEFDRTLKYKKPIFKEYKLYKIGEWELEVSFVDDEWHYAEIEFPSEEEAKAFVAPDWFGEEVTYNPEYKMKNYWKRTRLGM